MFFKREFKYLIFYWNTEQLKNGFGFGSVELTRSKKIKNNDDINSINELLGKDTDRKFTVINYKRI